MKEQDIKLLKEAHMFGQFADDFDVPLAKPLRAAVRNMIEALPEPRVPVGVGPCRTCSGHGMIGGLTPHSGYDAEPCPDCLGVPRIPQPKPDRGKS